VLHAGCCAFGVGSSNWFEELTSDAALYGSLELRIPREIVGKGLRFSLRHALCAHICRYCLISESRKRNALLFPSSRSAFIVFPIGSQSDGCKDIEIGIFGAKPNRLWDRDRSPAIRGLETRYSLYPRA